MTVTPNFKQLQRAMVFIDGTNLFYRLEEAKLVVPRISDFFRYKSICGGREIKRMYLYSIQHHIKHAKERHGANCLDGLRVVLGDGIPTAGQNVKEKGVDALLVADLVYHAASRNCDYALLVSTDTDFVFAIKRVEDFGCRTAVVGICSELPDRLKENCDQHFLITAQEIIDHKLGKNA